MLVEMTDQTRCACVGAAIALLVACDEKKYPDATAPKEASSVAASGAPALADGNTGKLVIKNKCNVSEGGLYVFAAIHDVTVWPKHGDQDAREEVCIAGIKAFDPLLERLRALSARARAEDSARDSDPGSPPK